MLVLAVSGLALGAAFQPAVEQAASVVPAARALEQVAADRRHVPQLRRRGQADGLGERPVPLADGRVTLDLAERGERPKRQSTLGLLDAAREPFGPLDVYQQRWLDDIRLHQGQEIGAAGQEALAVLGRVRTVDEPWRLVHGGGARVLERPHRRPPCRWL